MKNPARLPDLTLVGLLRRYSKKVHLISVAQRLHKLLEVEPQAELIADPVRVHRVEWRLGEDGIKELTVDYEAGLAVPELQVKYGLSKGSVRKLLHGAGVVMRRHRLPDEVIQQVIELYESGLSIREAAAAVGVPKTTIQNTLAKTDVVMRPTVRVSRSSRLGR